MKSKSGNKSVKLIVLFLLALLFSSYLYSQKINETIPKKVLSNLTKGINLSHYEKYWEPGEVLLQHSIAAELRKIQQLGFESVRLPVAFDHFITNGKLSDRLLNCIDSVVALTAQLKLSLIIVYHHGKLTNQNHAAEVERIAIFWKQLAIRYQNQYKQTLFFELYNEPVIEHGIWKKTITELVAAIRKIDTFRYFIIGGSSYNSIDALDKLGIIGDPFTIYTFHFYEPFFFTHQGASWQKEERRLKNIPYPFVRDAPIPEIFQQTDDGWLQATYWKYTHENDKHFLWQRIQKIIAYQQRYPGISVVCTETGVITKADQKSRNNYYKDVTDLFRKAGIGWFLWDYNSDFAVVDSREQLPAAIKVLLDSY